MALDNIIEITDTLLFRDVQTAVDFPHPFQPRHFSRLLEMFHLEMLHFVVSLPRL